MIAHKVRLKNKIKILLIQKGTDGISQTDLIQKCRTKIFKTEHIKEILEVWKTRQIVQSFSVTHRGNKKPTTIWRATELIKTERL